MHTGEGFVACDLCAKTFSNNTKLKIHMLGVHSGIKAFSCKICGSKFRSDANARRHEKTHTGEGRDQYFSKILKICKQSFFFTRLYVSSISENFLL